MSAITISEQKTMFICSCLFLCLVSTSQISFQGRQMDILTQNTEHQADRNQENFTISRRYCRPSDFMHNCLECEFADNTEKYELPEDNSSSTTQNQVEGISKSINQSSNNQSEKNRRVCIKCRSPYFLDQQTGKCTSQQKKYFQPQSTPQNANSEKISSRILTASSTFIDESLTYIPFAVMFILLSLRIVGLELLLVFQMIQLQLSVDQYSSMELSYNIHGFSDVSYFPWDVSAPSSGISLFNHWNFVFVMMLVSLTLGWILRLIGLWQINKQKITEEEEEIKRKKQMLKEEKRRKKNEEKLKRKEAEAQLRAIRQKFKEQDREDDCRQTGMSLNPNIILSGMKASDVNQMEKVSEEQESIQSDMSEAFVVHFKNSAKAIKTNKKINQQPAQQQLNHLKVSGSSSDDKPIRISLNGSTFFSPVENRSQNSQPSQALGISENNKLVSIGDYMVFGLTFNLMVSSLMIFSFSLTQEILYNGFNNFLSLEKVFSVAFYLVLSVVLMIHLRFDNPSWFGQSQLKFIKKFRNQQQKSKSDDSDHSENLKDFSDVSACNLSVDHKKRSKETIFRERSSSKDDSQFQQEEHVPTWFYYWLIVCFQRVLYGVLIGFETDIGIYLMVLLKLLTIVLVTIFKPFFTECQNQRSLAVQSIHLVVIVVYILQNRLFVFDSLIEGDEHYVDIFLLTMMSVALLITFCFVVREVQYCFRADYRRNESQDDQKKESSSNQQKNYESVKIEATRSSENIQDFSQQNQQRASAVFDHQSDKLSVNDREQPELTVTQAENSFQNPTNFQEPQVAQNQQSRPHYKRHRRAYQGTKTKTMKDNQEQTSKKFTPLSTETNKNPIDVQANKQSLQSQNLLHPNFNTSKNRVKFTDDSIPSAKQNLSSNKLQNNSTGFRSSPKSALKRHVRQKTSINPVNGEDTQEEQTSKVETSEGLQSSQLKLQPQKLYNRSAIVIQDEDFEGEAPQKENINALYDRQNSPPSKVRPTPKSAKKLRLRQFHINKKPSEVQKSPQKGIKEQKQIPKSSRHLPNHRKGVIAGIKSSGYLK